jgi:hypothetical protein
MVHAKIPESNLAVAAAGNELAQAATLHMNICNPLFVFTPDLDHRSGRLQSLIEDSDGSVTESSNKDITSNLIGC